jgi:hypothetical protein
MDSGAMTTTLEFAGRGVGVKLACVLLSVSTAAGAQAPLPRVDVPRGYEPPAGMCRVWLLDLPAVQQPAPTDCRSAVRGKPVNGTVIYGPDPKRSSFTPEDWVRPRVSGASALLDDGRAADSARDGASVNMPSMRAAILWSEGQYPAEMQRWFGAQPVSPRFQMPTRGGSPDRIQWVDADNRVVQIWLDRDRDGRADRIDVFGRDGARIRTIGQ